jgi:predicted ATPase
MKRLLPTGTVTFLFTDVESSTKLLHELGAHPYAQTLQKHRRVLRDAFQRHGGVEVDTQGDAFFVAFPTAPGAIAAASEAQEALEVPVRMGIHTGTPHVMGEGYVGADVHKAARIAASGHGGQVLVSAATAALLDENLRDLGEHRLKDLSAPERIYQLGEADFPPLKTLYRTNLPVPSTRFLGREHELARVLELLDETRLLTLTGPGGTGKTRLALQAAAEAADDYPDGVYWVPLAPLRDAQLVLEQAAQAVGASDGLTESIADKRLLLLVDNFEHLIEAADHFAPLQAACPNLRLLVTSRELLGLPGEQAFPVPPLEPEDGTRFFIARARAANPDFEPDEAVATLCTRLDNLPLALELAAARTRILSTAQLLERLSGRLDLLKAGRGVDARQQTLRATIEWSHELLDQDEKRLLARLAVFRGGCTLEAAETVCDADLDSLQSLVDKSLVRVRDHGRFWMLETIHQYASERLEASGEADELRRRHALYFVELAEQAYEDHLVGSEGAWFDTVDAEHDNVRAALDWASQVDPRADAQLAAAIAPYWMARGHARELRERLESAISSYSTPDRIRVRALIHRGEVDDVLETLEDALGLAREIGDPRSEAHALEAIGWAHDNNGQYREAERAHEESLAVRHRSDASALEGAASIAGLCHVLVSLGKIEEAEARARELHALVADSRASLMHQLALHFLADCPLVAGDYPEAERRYVEALDFATREGLIGRATDEVLGVAMALAGQGQSAKALRLAAAAHAQQEELGKSADHWWQSMQDRLIGGARTHVSPDELEEAERAGREAGFDAIVGELLGAPV